MSGEALKHLKTASSVGLSAEGAALFTGISRDGSYTETIQNAPPAPMGRVTWAALRPGHAFSLPGILDPAKPAAEVAELRNSIWGAFQHGAIAGDLAGSSSAAGRLSVAYGAYDDSKTDQHGPATPGWDPTEQVRRHSHEYTTLNRMGIAHTEAYIKQQAARHSSWHRKFKKAMRDAQSSEAVRVQAGRLRRRTASIAAQRFHSQLSKAKAQMRQPLGRTAPVHAKVRGEEEHCWQPRAAEGEANDAVEGVRDAEADAPRPEWHVRPASADQDLTLDDITNSEPSLSLAPTRTDGASSARSVVSGAALHG